MRYIIILAFLFTSILTVTANGGEEMEAIAAGGWSEWTDGLRGRLLLFKGRSMLTLQHRETLVFLELENKLGSGRMLDVYFNPDNLSCKLLDAGGAVVREHKTTENLRRQNERRRPTNCWVTLPDSSALRLRVSPCCAGYEKDFGLLVPLSGKAWLVNAEDTRDYFLSATFTVSAPTDDDRVNAWHGKLKLPKTKISLAAKRSPEN